ncbi:hypothetical protein [Streptomyces olivoreticuli]|uniref:hypothetical protein n=1 Tax=Streptomyces olivoreticuli TaxID=68246 RepID=UPI000E288126|nr:hypothetical protein [Streptomyces olivoreticuli]
MRLFRPVVVALAGLALALTVPTGPAVASEGQFSWVGPKGKPFFVDNPPDGKCLTMSQEARSPYNGTAGPATVYAGKKCDGTSHRLTRGKRADATFSSVRFSAH